MIPLDNEAMRGVVKSAYDHIGNGEEHNFKAEIIKILIERELKNYAGNTKPDWKELKLFVDRVCKMIKDELIKISGNDKLVCVIFV